MRKNINQENIEGRVYESKLQLKTVQNEKSENFGKEFINGELLIATDEAGMNIIPVHYSYVTEKTKANKVNNTFTVLKKIIDEECSWLQKGKENALKVKLSPSLSLNDFYLEDGTLISSQRNEGGFANIINELNPNEKERNKFKVDVVINSITNVDADPEAHIEKDYVKLRGAIFDFRNALLPVTLVVKNENGMKYFNSKEVSDREPLYTQVWGRINCNSTKEEKIEESSWGEATVTTRERKVKEWVVTGSLVEPYDFGDEAVLTAEELSKAIQDRAIHLAETKKDNDLWRLNASSSASTSNNFNFSTAAPQGAVQAGAFNF